MAGASRLHGQRRSQPSSSAASPIWTTLLLLLLGVLLLSGVSTPAFAQAVRPSTFITSTRPSPTTAPTAARRPDHTPGSGGPSGPANPQNTAQRAGGVQQASTASTVVVAHSEKQSDSAAAAVQTDAPLVSSNSSSAMAPITTEATVTGSAALDTKLDAAFGILGASLVLSGLVLATAGAAYKRLTCFIVTSYAMAIVTMALILHFGIEKQIDPPRSGIRVAFVVASLAGGMVFGLVAAIFHRGAKIIIAPVAGFLLGLVLQSVRNDGLVRPIGPRYLLFLGIAGLAFILGLIPRYFDAVLLVSTAFLGALAFSLGIDCFTTAGLKEFFIMNLGFTGIFPQLEGHFSISSIMQIELGLIALVFCISIAIQIRFFNPFEKRLARLFAKTEESEKRRREEEEAASRINNVMNGDVEKFEHRYSRRFPFAIPSALPTLPSQAHFDSKTSSPSLGSQTTSFNTPKSESTPFLPELTYVTTGAKKAASGRNDDNTPAMKTSESNKSFFSQMKSFMQTTGDTPPVPSLKTIDTEESKDVLAKEIAEREEALEKIKTIRQSIDNIRTHLRTHSEEESSLSSAPKVTSNSGPSRSVSPPVDAAKPQNHRHSVSFGSIVGAVPATPRRASASFTAPRPLSQDSVITTQQHVRPSAPPPQGHARSASQQTFTSVQRPTSTYSNWVIGQEDSDSAAMQHRRQSTLTIDTGRTSITQGEIRHSQRVVFVEPRTSTGPQRVVTGIMPARVPTEQTKAAVPQRQSIVRTMDILDLHAKHRRRLSEIQNSIPSTSAAPTSVTMTTSASQPTLKAVEPVRKRSSTEMGLSTIQSASLPTDLKKLKRTSDIPGMSIDELGRRPSSTQVKDGMSPSPTMPIGISGTSKLPTLSKLPTNVNKPIKMTPTLEAATLEAAKDSEAAWLSY